jgi:hypothetical protein
MKARFGAGVAVVLLGLLVPRLAAAFCGFYAGGASGDGVTTGKLVADATRVVMMREGTRTVLAMQNDYAGPPKDFAMVVPVPVVLQKENVKTLPRAVFAHVDTLSAPRLVEYWEQDPCRVIGDLKIGKGAGMVVQGGKGSGLTYAPGKVSVKIEAEFEVGEYEIVILSARDSSGLDGWLRGHGYTLPDNSELALRPYVQAGSKFLVAKVDIAKIKLEGGRAQLSPLRFHYDSDTFTLPVRLGMLNSSGVQDLVVHILAPRGQRYTVANYPTATIPTNLEVAESARRNFPAFYAALFDKTLEKTPNAIVTEYAWGTDSCEPPCTRNLGLSPDELASLGADVLPSARFGPIDETTRLGQGPIGEVAIGALESKSGPAPNDGPRVLSSVRPRLRACYRVGLDNDPSMAGSLKLEVDVASPSGEVGEVEVLANTGLSPNVARCAQNVLRHAVFSVPSAPASFVVTLALTHASSVAAPSASEAALPPEIGLRSIGADFVLTRLHTRYARGALGDDLRFKADGAMTGGRESRKKNGDLEAGATKDATNTFQARYVIRHPWPHAVACESPQRGVWGGPWPNAGVAESTTVATQLAYAPRGNVTLASFVPKGVPELGVVGAAPPETPTAGTDGATSTPTFSAPSATADAEGSASPSPAPTSAGKARCGCTVVGARGGELPLVAASGLLVVALRARRRRRG